MKKLIALTCINAAAACTGSPPAETSRADAVQLSAALEGYEQAGPAVSCVNTRDIEGNRSAGEGAIIFRGRTSASLWVNSPPAGCPELDSGRALITRTPTTRLCRGDIATVFDPVSGIQYGSCGLGDFTPYRRVAQR